MAGMTAGSLDVISAERKMEISKSSFDNTLMIKTAHNTKETFELLASKTF
jgi:hypothetical protein